MNQPKISEKNFSNLFAAIDDLVIICNQTGKIFYANNAVSKRLGYSNKELDGMQILKLYPANLRKKTKKIIINIFAQKINNCLPPLRTKSGKLIPCETKCWLGKWGDKECMFIISKNLSRAQKRHTKFDKLFVGKLIAMAISEFPSRKFTEVNTAFLKKLEYKKSEIIGKTASDLGIFIEPEKQKQIEGVLQKKGYIRNLEMKIRTKTNVILDCVFSEEIFKSQNKKFLLTIVMDVTECKRTEGEIRESLDQQKILAKISTKLNQYVDFHKMMGNILKEISIYIHASRSYIFKNNPDGKTTNNTYEWCANKITPQIDNLKNIAFAELPPFLKNLNKRGLFLSHNISKLPMDIRKTLEPQNIKSILVLPLIVKNNYFGFIGFDQTNKRREWKTSEIIVLRTIADSISGVYERKFSNEEIQFKTEQISREKSKIETIIQSIGDAVFVVDSNLQIILFNPIASQLSGYSEEEALGKNYTEILQFVHESDPQKPNSDFIDQAMATGETQSMPSDTLLISKKGEKIPVADSAVPLKNAQGKIIGCVVVFRDATREREIDRMKSEFVSLASHQLKTPMTGIKWMSELILKEDLSDKQKDYMKDIYESTNKLVYLVDDLLNLSHIETGRHFKVIKRSANLNKIIEEVIKDKQKFAQIKKVDVKYKKSLNKLTLNIDRDKIKLSLDNILNNSIKYSRENGKVLVSFTKKGKEAIIRIKDDGIGIPQAQQKRIFEKFFRANNVDQSDYGTGLGLAIAKSIIEANGGHIWFKSKAGSGTTFYIGLPLKNI